jgi:hypothetical protein
LATLTLSFFSNNEPYLDGNGNPKASLEAKLLYSLSLWLTAFLQELSWIISSYQRPLAALASSNYVGAHAKSMKKNICVPLQVADKKAQ